jgi:CheY-like chemotaxis protein
MNQRALSRAGYQVLTAHDGEEAVSVAQGRLPNLILLDMLLPKLGGPQVLRVLKQSQATKDIPVVVLSSLPQSNEARLKKEGAAAYFDKSALALAEGSDSIVRIVQSVLGEESPALAGSPDQECVGTRLQRK